MKKISIFIFSLLTSVPLFADECILANTVSGTDNTCSITFDNFVCAGSSTMDQVLLDVLMEDPLDGEDYCIDDWYSYDVIIDGTTVLTDQCSQNGIDLSTYYPFTSVVVSMHDDDFWTDNVILTATLHLEYTATCSAPVNTIASNITQDGADIDWDPVGNGIEYTIVWGTSGFVPGTGADIGSESGITGTSASLSNLVPGMNYDIYVMTDCDADGISNWSSPIGLTTLCGPKPLPWYETFDGMTNLGDGVFPNCMVQSDYGWYSVHSDTYNEDADALSPDHFLVMEYGSDSYLFTPEFELTAGETYEFHFNWAGDGYSGWDGEVVVSQTQSDGDAEVIGSPFVAYGDETTLDYQHELYCFTPTADGIYSFGIHVTESDYWWYLSIDDLSVKLAPASVGTDGNVTVCEQSGLVDLDNVANITDPDGVWQFDYNPSALVNGHQLNIDNIPNTTVIATYSIQSCLAQDVTATITVIPAISAGTNGTIDNVCMNQPINLLAGLSNDATLGGQWYNSSSELIDPYINTGNLAGQFNFKYIVSNGICPDDTATVIVNVQACDYLSIEDLNGTDVSIYPNPTSGKITISGDFDGKETFYSMTDLNGKTILRSPSVISNKQEVDLSNVPDGIYLLRIQTTDASMLYRIVKQ